MAAMFAGASRAPLASVVFAFETTRQAVGLLPLLGGCCVSKSSYQVDLLPSRRRGTMERAEGEFSVLYAYKWARSAIFKRAQAFVFMSLNPAIR